MITSSAFSRDANGVPITTDGITVTKSVTFSGSAATVAVPIFSITGSVEIRALYGVVTTVLANHTAAHWRINDQTASNVVITKATGTTVTDAPVGSLILANVLASTALTLKSSAAGAMLQPAAVNAQIFSPCIFTQKTGDIETDIEYVYTTSDEPTTGVIEFFVKWLPISSDGDLSAI